MRPLQCLLAALAVGLFPSAAAREEYYSDLKACPVACSSTEDPSQWTLYSSLNRLTFCEYPVLFDVSLSGHAAPTRHAVARVRACTASEPDKDEKVIVNSIIPPPADGAGSVEKRQDSCPQPTRNSPAVPLLSKGARSSTWTSLALNGLAEIRDWVAKKEGCGESPSVLFSHVNGTVLGYFAGARVDSSAASDLFDTMSDDLSSRGSPKRLLLQHCGSGEGSDSKPVSGGVAFGLVVDMDFGFVGVQKAVRAWNNGECATLDGDDVESERVSGLDMRFFSSSSASNPAADEGITPGSSRNGSASNALEARQGPAECRWIRVEANEGCGELAARCGITGDRYMSYNSQDNHCSTLRRGQPVCCSSGRLPTIRPRENSDGSCFSYTVKANDNCADISAYWGIEMKDFALFNDKKTWGWTGCDPLMNGINICLSTGQPPMPAPVDNAVCGPTVPGTEPPKGLQGIEDLNQCPLNACCSIWGHCGTTAEFCVKGLASTGAPGTSGPNGRGGCIQNCGMDVINNGTKPSKFYKLGYFEGWNRERECLHMDVRAVQDHPHQYTDIHFAFAHITPDYNVEIPEDSREEFAKFLNIRGPRRILAFGGWTFSAENPHFYLFREATAPANRIRFADNCVNFLIRYNLDGLDFDWEYPGAPDLPGIPPGSPQEPYNYLTFLGLVKARLARLQGKTLSIAAPASFWYLKQFPIRDMAVYLDYIVFMTYDLHGQWDAGNRWSNPGCPSGSCLRSHVNWTETYNALTMITKAGVPANKVLMGVASYGRSFKMAQAGCDGPQCLFLGGRFNSQAKKGRCTDTGGYLANAEIYELRDTNRQVRRWVDMTTRDSYLVYDNTEWVAYLDTAMRNWRELQASLLNFGGTIEWAVDLQEFLPGAGGMNTEPRDDLWNKPPECRETTPHGTLEALGRDSSIPAWCLPLYTLEVLRRIAQNSVDIYRRLMRNGYEDNFRRFRAAAARAARDGVDAWVIENSREYFTCVVRHVRRCCNSCPDNDCPGIVGCVREDVNPLCNGLNREVYTDPVAIQCPNRVEPAAELTGDIFFTMRSEKRDEFYRKITEEFGVLQENMDVRAETIYKRHIRYSPSELCSAGETNCMANYYKNIPYALYNLHHVPDPSEVMGPAYENATDTIATLYGYEHSIRMGLLQDDPSLIVDALSLPVLMLNESAYGMERVQEIGKEIEDEENENLALLIVQAVLFVIPFLGKIVGSLSVTAMAIRIAAGLIGDLGLIGVDIYRIVEATTDEERAMLGVGIGLTGMGSLFNIPSIRQAGELRRATRDAAARRIVDNPNVDLTRAIQQRYGGACPARFRYA